MGDIFIQAMCSFTNSTLTVFQGFVAFSNYTMTVIQRSVSFSNYTWMVFQEYIFLGNCHGRITQGTTESQNWTPIEKCIIFRNL